ncbi:transcriptional regulator [Pseudomonas putida]|uniref:Transcriptional regulator n=1 Tax=Pseudomonas putida TaxID=303 RepID=A0AA37REZ5_PSEPU|nr:TetR/AcrR family transcriptional regulator [Pseudomonas putida]GLO13307.1 transcriptional regulator [Pseudomonas putida]GLO36671.1 transcriptional regulator [Pseudomonas putida]HDS0963097.1 TetR family transcriptional regulator C-terminal domain-containing protein [Pseudomonas putida]HDS0991558.1 TetR family transcriptional regulator C-terminal domain-containing protein [Pseudomonas putida]
MYAQPDTPDTANEDANALYGVIDQSLGNPGIRRKNQKLILKAASESFAATGFTATHSHEIAERAGVPKANLYYYFQTKENLYVQVLMSFVEPLVKASAALRKNDDPIAGLRAYIKARIRIIREHPFSAAVFSQELLSGGRRLPEACKNVLHEEARHNVACLRNWIDHGRLAPCDPEHLMIFIWSATRTYTNLAWQMSQIRGVAQPDKSDFDRATRTVTRMVLSGVVPKPQPTVTLP